MNTNELKKEVLLDILVEKLKEVEEETKDEYTSMFSRGELDFNLLLMERNFLDQLKELKEKALEQRKKPLHQVTFDKDSSEWVKQRKKQLKSKEWKEKREEVFQRYGRQCAECGTTKNLQIHHLVYRNVPHIWNYDVTDFLPLCKDCHEKVHNDTSHPLHEKYVH